MTRTYSELIKLPTYAERYDYLKLDGAVGIDTFGFERYLNQEFYNSLQWKQVRDQVIVRDMGNDLGIDGLPITGRIIIHHMNPVSVKDFENGRAGRILDPEFLICVSHKTHNGIHYGIKLSERPECNYVERTAGDTCPWKVGA